MILFTNVSRAVSSRWAPSGHWFVLGILLLALTAALLVQGYARRQVGRSTTVAPGVSSPAIW